MHASRINSFVVLAAGSLLLLAGHAAGAGGEVVWSRTFAAPDGAGAPRTGPDGDLYWVARDTLFKAGTGGEIIWRRVRASSFGFGAAPVRIYAGGITESASPQNAVRAITLDNQIVWEYTDLAGIQGFIGGPDVGPDGNIYTTADGPTNGAGMLSLTPAGGSPRASPPSPSPPRSRPTRRWSTSPPTPSGAAAPRRTCSPCA